MTPPLLTATNLTKTHRVRRQGPVSLKEWLVKRRTREAGWREIHALRDVSLHIQPNECLGIIGSNGAGKSTLLRVLAGITAPDAGNVSCTVGLAALLELGVGFHPELSGRENMELWAALHGWPKAMLAARRDEIVAFAGLEEFLDHPVKHYSSGMLVRLGFSLAVHGDARLLLLDEIMAVGDQEFQQASRARLESHRSLGGGTILITHDLALVERACDRAIWIDRGMVAAEGEPARVVDDYLATQREAVLSSGPKSAPSLRDHSLANRGRFGSGELVIAAVRLVDHHENARRVFHQTMRLRAVLTIRRPMPNVIDAERARKQLPVRPNLFVGLQRVDGLPIALVNAFSATGELLPLPERGQESDYVFEIDLDALAPETYSLSFGLFPGSVKTHPDDDRDYPYDCQLQMYEFVVVGDDDGRHDEALLNIAPDAIEARAIS